MYNNSKKMFRIISINEISIIKTICYLSYKPACYNYSRNTFICLRNVSFKVPYFENNTELYRHKPYLLNLAIFFKE